MFDAKCQILFSSHLYMSFTPSGMCQCFWAPMPRVEPNPSLLKLNLLTFLDFVHIPVFNHILVLVFIISLFGLSILFLPHPAHCVCCSTSYGCYSSHCRRRQIIRWTARQDCVG